jgi:uncharacterized membrane protein YbhN (UPF0104 family)
MLITLAKITASLAIIGYLFYRAIDTPAGRKAFVEMLDKQKTWGMLAAGFVVLFIAVTITIVRWWYLVRALEIDFSLPDALRIGFLGYLFNLAPAGIVGGDLLKAWMLAREKPGNRAKLLASVIVDRIVGLYVLLLVAALGVFLTGFWQIADPKVHLVCLAVLAITAVSTAGLALVLIPGFLESRLVQSFTRIPKIGLAIGSLLEAIVIYRVKRAVLFWTLAATVPVHVLVALSIYFLALGLGFRAVPCRDYFTIYPVSGILGTIPLPAGPQETGIVFLYRTAWMRSPEGGSDERSPQADPEKSEQQKTALQKAAQQQGLILALVCRLSSILIAPIGGAYYFLGARGEVKEVMHDLEKDEDHPPPPR